MAVREEITSKKICQELSSVILLNVIGFSFMVLSSLPAVGQIQTSSWIPGICWRQPTACLGHMTENKMNINEFCRFINEKHRLINEIHGFINEFYFFINEFHSFINEFYFFINEFHPFLNDMFRLRHDFLCRTIKGTLFWRENSN